MPAQAGIQTYLNSLGSRLRGNDENGICQTLLKRYCATRSIKPSRAPFHAAGRYAVIADDDTIVFADDIGARGAAFALGGTVSQPIVELRLAAVEPAEIVRGAERRRRRERAQRFAYLCQSGRRFISARSLGPAGGGLSSARMNAAY